MILTRADHPLQEGLKVMNAAKLFLHMLSVVLNSNAMLSTLAWARFSTTLTNGAAAAMTVGDQNRGDSWSAWTDTWAHTGPCLTSSRPKSDAVAAKGPRALLRRPVVRARRATGAVGPWESERMRPAPASSIRLQSVG